MRQGLVFASRHRSRKNRRTRRSMKARRTARRSSRRLHFFGVLKRNSRAQRGGNYAYRIPGDATRDFQRMEDDGFSQPIMVTQEEAEKMAEDERM
jgi:hypothetical protein